jgi:hypothetical protein
VALRGTLTTPRAACAAAAQLSPCEDDPDRVLARADPSESVAHLDAPALDRPVVVCVGGSTHRIDRACQRAEAPFRRPYALALHAWLLRNDVDVRRRSGRRRWRLVARVVADRGRRLLRGVRFLQLALWPTIPAEEAVLRRGARSSAPRQPTIEANGIDCGASSLWIDDHPRVDGPTAGARRPSA